MIRNVSPHSAATANLATTHDDAECSERAQARAVSYRPATRWIFSNERDAQPPGGATSNAHATTPQLVSGSPRPIGANVNAFKQQQKAAIQAAQPLISTAATAEYDKYQRNKRVDQASSE